MSEDKSNQYNKDKQLLQNLLKQLLDKKLTKIENNSKEHLSILSSAKIMQNKMSNILTDIQKKIFNKQNPKGKLNVDKIICNKANKDLNYIHNRSKIKSNFLNNNYPNKKNVNEKTKNNNNELHKNPINKISKNKKSNKSKSKTSKINYFKNIQNNYLINLYGDNINIISNDEKINYNAITHRPKYSMKKHNTMFNLYKKGVKTNNCITSNHNITSRYKSNNNSILDLSDICNRSVGKKNTIEGKKRSIKKIGLKNNKKILNKKNMPRKKTPCNARTKSYYNIKLKHYEELNINNIKKSIKIKKLNETTNFNSKESKIINEMISLNTTINKDELIVNDNDILFDIEDEDIFKNMDIINKHSLSLSNSNKKFKKILHWKNTKIEDNSNKIGLLDFINNEYFNYILEYLSIEDLIKIKGVSKSCTIRCENIPYI